MTTAVRRVNVVIVVAVVVLAAGVCAANHRDASTEGQSITRHTGDQDDIDWVQIADGVWEGYDGGNNKIIRTEGEAGLLWEIDRLQGWLRRIDEMDDPSDERFKDLYEQKLKFLYHAYFVYHGGTRQTQTACSTCEPLTGAWYSVKWFPSVGTFWADADINGPFGNCPASCQVCAGVNGNIWSDSSPTQHCDQHAYDYVGEIPYLSCRTSLRNSYNDNECARATYFWLGPGLYVQEIGEIPEDCYECPNCS